MYLPLELFAYKKDSESVNASWIYAVNLILVIVATSLMVYNLHVQFGYTSSVDPITKQV
jgi:hypothetical protein